MAKSQYFMLEDFAAGIDLRKSVITSKPGTLRTLSNGFVNAGGEIEKRRRFSLLATVPANTAGLGNIDNKLYVFGTDAGVSVPTPIIYHRLVPTGGGVTISRVLDVEVFGAKLFVIARFSDGSVRRFYDGVQVTGGSSGGAAARAHKSKMYAVDGAVYRMSAVNNAADWAGTGSGLVDTTTQDQGSPDLIALEQYYSFLALLGRRQIQIWSMDPDPSKNQLVQVMGNVGIVAPQAAARYGTGDVIFLADTGLRSIRARDSSNAAAVNDIGSPIDELIANRRLSLSSSESEQIRALVDPVTGHFWLAWGTTIYVLAYYPATKVTAWSTFSFPLATDYAVAAGTRVAVRSGNNIYVYGGFTAPGTALDNYVPTATLANEYDDTVCQIETPMLDLGRPAHLKQFHGVDLAIEGSWLVEANFDPLNPGAWSSVGTFSQTTYSLARVPLHATSTHVALRLTSTNTGPARVGAMAIHHSVGDAE